MMRAYGALGVMGVGMAVLMTAACDRNEAERASEKAGQTVTTAADHALDAGKLELKREWNDLDVKVTTGTTPDAPAPALGLGLGLTDGGKVERSPRPARP